MASGVPDPSIAQAGNSQQQASPGYLDFRGNGGYYPQTPGQAPQGYGAYAYSPGQYDPNAQRAPTPQEVSGVTNTVANIDPWHPERTVAALNNAPQATKGDTWGAGQSVAKPWLNNKDAAQDTRNNLSYGGYVGGANDFLGRVAGAAGGLGAEFQGVQGNARGMQNNALAAQGQAQTMMANAQAAQANAAGADPTAFIDRSQVANNAFDRNAQVGAYNQLNSFANQGPGPSAAQGQLNQATDMNMANSLALARSGRGMGQSAGALRQAIGQNAITGQQAANQSAMLTAQENQAYQNQRLNALSGMGSLAGQARAGDVQAGSYTSGTAQARENASNQLSLGYGQQALGYGQLGLGYGGQMLGAGQLGFSATQANAGTQANLLGLQNTVNATAMQGNSDYENNLLNYYRIKAQQPVEKGTDYSPYIQLGATALGTMVGGPGGGALAGGAAKVATDTDT